MRPSRRSPLVLGLLLALAGGAAAQTASEARKRALSMLGGAAPEAPEVREPPSAELAPPSEKARRVDLNSQFYDHERDQGDIGACHAFASVALIEAAWQRSKGSCVRLSEADLFLRRTVMNWRCGPDCDGQREGNIVAGDLDYALANGLLPGRVYGDFARQYAQWRARRFPASDDPLPPEERTFLDRYLLNPIGVSRRAVYPPKVVRAALTEYQRQADAESLLAARESVKNDLAGFRHGTRSFAGAGAGCERDAPFGAGKEQIEAVSRELDAGRPVAVSMDLSGLGAWMMNDVDDAWHAFVIVGYRDEGAAGHFSRTFQTRNSWQIQGKSLDPEIPHSLMCRIAAIDSVTAPGEKPSF